MPVKKKTKRIKDLDLALEKSQELQKEQQSYLDSPLLRYRNLIIREAYLPTVLFAQYECGTGVCIHADGLILTCAHVLGDEPAIEIEKLILFVDGTICLAVSIKVDALCDVALLRITGQYNSEMEFDSSSKQYPCASLLDEALLPRRKLICFGQAGRDDLEATVDRKTNYPLVSISTGLYQKCAEGDVMDNSELGKLQHSCWTLWRGSV